MRRVYAIWFVKRVAPAIVLEFSGFLALFYALRKMIFARMVVENAITAFAARPWTSWAFYEFTSFLDKRIVVQILFLGTILIILFVIKNIFKATVEFSIMKYENKPVRYAAK